MTKSILDKDFPYRDSHNTDIANSEEWAKAQKKIEEQKREREELKKKIDQLPRIGKRLA